MKKLIVLILFVITLTGCAAQSTPVCKCAGDANLTEQYRVELQKYQIMFGTPEDWDRPPELNDEQVKALQVYLRETMKEAVGNTSPPSLP